MQCEDAGSVAWFVHECMERVDNVTVILAESRTM
jgi:hypothetical protein